MPRSDRSGSEAGFKRREAVFERLRARLLRESSNRDALMQAKARVLSDPAVRGDPALTAMIHALIAERLAHFAAGGGGTDDRSSSAFGLHGDVRHAHTPEELRSTHAHLERQFHAHVAHLDEPEALSVLERIRALHDGHRDVFAIAETRRFEEALQHLSQRLGHIHEQIDRLAERAVEAAARGDHAETSKALRRLSGVHAAHPRLLDDVRLRQVQEQVVQAGEQPTHRDAARELIERERAIAAEIRRLGTIVHRFHLVARTVPHDEDGYRKAEAAYRRAVADVQAHDADWQAALILELVELLDDWHGRPPAASKRLDHFLDAVRSALSRIQTEIREIDRERHQPPSA